MYACDTDIGQLYLITNHNKVRNNNIQFLAVLLFVTGLLWAASLMA